MRLAICDDNRAFLRELGEHLCTLPLIESVAAFYTIESFLSSVEEGARYDAALIDLYWNQRRTGMDAAELLYAMSPDTRVVFVTGYSDRFVQQIFLRRSNLSGFLTKPVDPRLLRQNLEKIAAEKARRRETVTVLSRGSAVTLFVDEILSLQSRDHTVLVRTASGTLPVYRRLDDMETLLPDGFFRCHRSFLVNLRQVRRVEQPDLLLRDGSRVPVSRARYAATREAFLRFVGQSI